MAYFKMYKNNPTEGALDGTEISSDDSGTSPLSVKLNATQSETAVIKVAARCEEGYQISEGLEITFEGKTKDKWQIGLDNGYPNETVAGSMIEWASEVTLESVTTVNKVFWVKAMSSGAEKPMNDRTVKMVAYGSVEAVE